MKTRKFSFKYVVDGKESHIDFETGAKYNVEIAKPKQPGNGLSDNELKQKLKKMREFVSRGNVLFILNDGERPTPTARILETISDCITEKRMNFIIATGSHRPPTDDELKTILGRFYEPLKERVIIHKAKESRTVYIGKTRRGTEVSVNEAIFGHDRIVNINSVEPHYFAGYTGGRKSFLPGVSSYSTIEQNHSHAMHPNSKTLSMEGNPVHEDMIDAVGMITGKIKEKHRTEFLTVNIVIASGQIFNLSFDNPLSISVIEDVNRIFCSEIKHQPDIVVAITDYPANKNLYQALKSFENGRIVVGKGGIIVLVAPCTDGIGTKKFYEILVSGDKPEKIIESVKKNYELGAHKSTNLVSFLLEGNRVYIVSQLDDEAVKKAWMIPFASIQDALNEAISVKEKEGIIPSILILEDAANTVPLLR